jgi:phospholipid/cholesterol/gamma-HCH transport system substrate-binding protein
MLGSRDLKVGLFVVAGIFLFGMVVFLIGQERNLFSRSIEFQTSFPDVGGLKVGAPVRMGGIDVGQVSRIGYDAKAPEDATVYVTFWVRREDAPRVRTGSRTRIGNKGLLGDKMVELISGEGDPVPSGTRIPGDPPNDMFGKVGTMADKAEAVLDNVERATRPLGDEKLHKDIQASVASINTILHEIAHGDGYPHKFLSDPEEAARISRVVENLEKTTNEAQAAIRDVRVLAARVQTGPGFAHDVLYGQPQGLPEFANAANEVSATLKGIRDGNGLAKDALFGGTGENAQGVTTVVKNLADISTDVRSIVADVRAGKGTIGGLLVDPTIYEDVKLVLGNVQRNDVLRALVRYSINKDQEKPQVNVASPK